MRFLTTTESRLAPTILRVVLGAVMFPHGAQKALGLFGGNGFKATLEFFEINLGLPNYVAVLVILAEFLGAIGLILGLLTRVAALGIGAVMVGAVVMVHFDHGFFMNWYGTQVGEGYEYHLLAIAMSIALVITGGGAFSVDRAISNKR